MTQPLRISTDDARPCDACGKQTAPVFFRVDVRHAVVNVRGMQRLAGTAQILGGGAQAIGVADALTGEHFAECTDPIVLFLCTDCFSCSRVAEAWANRGNAIEKTGERDP